MPDDTPELIELQMTETRDSLTQKISALEDQVMGTLQNATSTVTNLLDSAKNVVPDTVANVKEAVSEQINTTFNLSRHTRERPWPMVGGSAALGFITGMVLFRRVYAAPSRAAADSVGYSAASMPTSAPSAPMKLPGWVQQIVDNLGERVSAELKKIGETAVDTGSKLLQQTLEGAMHPGNRTAQAPAGNGYRQTASHM